MSEERNGEGAEGGEVRVAYCSACDREVRLQVPPDTPSEEKGGSCLQRYLGDLLRKLAPVLEIKRRGSFGPDDEIFGPIAFSPQRQVAIDFDCIKLIVRSPLHLLGNVPLDKCRL